MIRILTCGLLGLFLCSYAFAAGDPQMGRQLSQSCVVCHGADGNSNNPIWPNIAGQHSSYLIKQLKDFKEGRRKGPQMTGVVAKLSEQDIEDIAAYFASQQTRRGAARPDKIAVGQNIYRAGDRATGVPACMACHSPSGAGNPAALYPALSGQHTAYTVMQLKAFKLKVRSNDKNAVMRTIASRMSDVQIEAVAEYIQGLHSTHPDHMLKDR